MNDLERAIDVAVDAHAGQTDKAGETYIRHPLRVMRSMDSETERIVAVLHDVVEDGDYTSEDIGDQFGPEVRRAVDALTKRDGETYMEFIKRAAENPIARKVKIADLEDNMDLTRLGEVNKRVLEKQSTYHQAWIRLQNEDRIDRE